jgi:hypothetical protein
LMMKTDRFRYASGVSTPNSKQQMDPARNDRDNPTHFPAPTRFTPPSGDSDEARNFPARRLR